MIRISLILKHWILSGRISSAWTSNRLIRFMISVLEEMFSNEEIPEHFTGPCETHLSILLFGRISIFFYLCLCLCHTWPAQEEKAVLSNNKLSQLVGHPERTFQLANISGLLHFSLPCVRADAGDCDDMTQEDHLTLQNSYLSTECLRVQ